MDNRVDRVLSALKGLEIKCNVPLSTLTSFRIGGPAAMVLRPHGAEDIRRAIQSCSQYFGRTRLSLRVRLVVA